MLVLKIKGKKIQNFIKKIYDNKIDLFKIKKINNEEIIVYIKKEDFEKINKIKTIYEIECIDVSGKTKIIENLKKNIPLFIMMLISIITIYILSNLIFKIEIITNNNKLKEELKKELEENGIYKYNIKKNYKELSEIKNKIKEKYRDNIEWLEIENVGVKCILKLEERIVNSKDETSELLNIVSLKDAIIKDVTASNGIILKRKNESVKKGEIVISGKIKLNDEIKEIVNAKGKVMGEVWYKTTISYPLTYYEEKITGKKNTRFSVKIFNKSINFFKKNGKIEQKPLFESNIFSLYKNTIYDVEIIDIVYTYDEAVEKAIELGRKKMNSKLNDEEYIIYEKCLKVSSKDSKIELEMFYAVYENITGYERIEVDG